MMVIVHELEDMGLVERRPDPADSRAKLIDFTGSGRRFISELTRSTQAVYEQYAEIVGEHRLQAALDSFDALLQAGTGDKNE